MGLFARLWGGGFGSALEQIPGVTPLTLAGYTSGGAPPAQAGLPNAAVQPQPAPAQPAFRVDAPRLESLGAPTAAAAGPSPTAPARGGLLTRIARGISGDPANNQPGLVDNPLWQLGGALLANAERGGNWGNAFNAFAEAQQGTFNRRRMTAEDARVAAADAREREQFDWARSERGQRAERRRLAQDYINSRPEAERAELRMIDPDQLGTYLQQQREFGLQERQMDLQMQEMRDNRAFRGASLAMDRARLEQDRALNSASMVLGREEAQRLGGDIQRLRNWSTIDNDMAALEEILQRNPAAFNNLMEADVEQALARVRDPQTRRDVQTIYAIGTNMAREELRGQTPVSNIDLFSAIRSGPSPSSGSAFARDWLNRAYQDRSDLESYVQGAINYMQQPDGSRRTLFEPDPATGRNFYQSDTFRRYTQDGRQSFSDVRGGAGAGGGVGQSREAQEAAAALATRNGAAGASPSAGRVGGRASAPALLREPQTILERQAVSEYNTALQRGQTERARTLETRLRRAGLIP